VFVLSDRSSLETCPRGKTASREIESRRGIGKRREEEALRVILSKLFRKGQGGGRGGVEMNNAQGYERQKKKKKILNSKQKKRESGEPMKEICCGRGRPPVIKKDLRA